jgi:hypothetical protein
MLATAERVCEVEASQSDLQADHRYRSSARQMHEYLVLSYKQGNAWASAAYLKVKLGITKRTVGENNSLLETAGLIEIKKQAGPKGVNLIYPLPKGKGKKPSTYKAWAANALACKRLDLNYRVLWYLSGRSFRGGDVEISLGDMATVLKVTDPHNLWKAIQTNIARGRLAEVSGTGRGGGHTNCYRVMGTTFALSDENRSGVMVGNRFVDFDDPLFYEKISGEA